jgi:hypothetical protein
MGKFRNACGSAAKKVHYFKRSKELKDLVNAGGKTGDGQVLDQL